MKNICFVLLAGPIRRSTKNFFKLSKFYACVDGKSSCIYRVSRQTLTPLVSVTHGPKLNNLRCDWAICPAEENPEAKYVKLNL